MTYQFNEVDLTGEKSLWEVFILSRRVALSKLSCYVSLAAAGLLIINAFHFSTPTEIILRDLRRWAEVGLSFAVTTLGFLVAGYTIFATVADPKMMLAMMEHQDKETRLPTLKANHIKFMKVMIDYLLWILVYVFVMIYCQPGGMLANIARSMPNSLCVKSSLSRIGYVAIGTSLVYLIMILQSYIYNIYAVVMNMLRWEKHKID